MLFAVSSLKAQSLQQKFQKNNEDRRKQANTVRLKAREQQTQQQLEKLNGTSKTIQPNIPAVPSQQKKEQAKTPLPIKKTEPINQPAAARKENTY